jgi:hypothetical protein
VAFAGDENHVCWAGGIEGGMDGQTSVFDDGYAMSVWAIDSTHDVGDDI